LEIEQLDQLISRRIRDAQQQKQDELLQTVPGIKPEAAANVLAEVGADMK
jgi:flagellar motility protein MotE (MotC chaperone)